MVFRFFDFGLLIHRFIHSCLRSFMSFISCHFIWHLNNHVLIDWFLTTSIFHCFSISQTFLIQWLLINHQKSCTKMIETRCRQGTDMFVQDVQLTEAKQFPAKAASCRPCVSKCSTQHPTDLPISFPWDVAGLCGHLPMVTVTMWHCTWWHDLCNHYVNYCEPHMIAYVVIIGTCPLVQ